MRAFSKSVAEVTDPLAIREHRLQRATERLARIDAEIALRETEALASQPPRWRTRRDGLLEMAVPSLNKTRRIHGICTTAIVDVHRQVLETAGCNARLPLPLRYGHEKIGGDIGQVYLLRRSAGLMYFRAAVDSGPAGDHAWSLIERGEVASVSVGPSSGRNQSEVRAVVDGVKYYSRWSLDEISLTRTPANAACRLETWDGRDDGRKFFEPVTRCHPDEPHEIAADTDLDYKGIWRADQTYEAGNFATSKGALWHANRDSRGDRPGTGSAWKLAVKRGGAAALEHKQ